MKVYLDTVGCRLNQAEIEGMARQLRAGGHEIVASAAQADLAIANTCTVTSLAAADSRSLIRRLAGSGAGGIVATGCWATLHRAEAGGMQGVVRVVPNSLKDNLVREVLGAINAGAHEVSRRPLPGPRHRTRAFIKVQDGCDNHCTFCVTTIARGQGRSRARPAVIADVRAALEGGAREIVLTGVHLGSWGSELGLHLSDLVRAILTETEAPRVRLSSLEPWDLDGDFFRLWEDRRLCRHVHMPLQSGCATTLKRMRRRTTPEAFRVLIQAARSVVPDVAITTDVIAGFPGEGESDFRASLEFVQKLELAGGHAFTFSPMAGTAAARMPDQVPLDVRKSRTREYLELFGIASCAFRESQLATQREVLWEASREIGEGAWVLGGLTDNYIRVEARAAQSRWNRIDTVLLQDLADDRVRGIIRES